MVENCLEKKNEYYTFNVKLGDLTVGKGTIGDNKMQNSDFKTTLRSYNYKKNCKISVVDINCDNFETFKKIVEAVMPILEKEDIKKECD